MNLSNTLTLIDLLNKAYSKTNLVKYIGEQVSQITNQDIKQFSYYEIIRDFIEHENFYLEDSWRHMCFNSRQAAIASLISEVSENTPSSELIRFISNIKSYEYREDT